MGTCEYFLYKCWYFPGNGRGREKLTFIEHFPWPRTWPSLLITSSMVGGYLCVLGLGFLCAGASVEWHTWPSSPLHFLISPGGRGACLGETKGRHLVFWVQVFPGLLHTCLPAGKGIRFSWSWCGSSQKQALLQEEVRRGQHGLWQGGQAYTIWGWSLGSPWGSHR